LFAGEDEVADDQQTDFLIPRRLMDAAALLISAPSSRLTILSATAVDAARSGSSMWMYLWVMALDACPYADAIKHPHHADEMSISPA